MARNHPKRRNAQGPAGQDGSPRPRQDRPRERSGGGDGEGWLWGTHAVTAALANPSRTLHKLLATENAAARLGAARITPEIILGKDLDNRLPAGAVETVAEARVVNIARALEQLADAGYHTVGLAGEGRRSLADAVAGTAKLAIVMGAEGSGLRPAVAKACAELARIPIAPEMESLNVSNAAAIAFYEASRDRFPAA